MFILCTILYEVSCRSFYVQFCTNFHAGHSMYNSVRSFMLFILCTILYECYTRFYALHSIHNSVSVFMPFILYPILYDNLCRSFCAQFCSRYIVTTFFLCCSLCPSRQGLGVWAGLDVVQAPGGSVFGIGPGPRVPGPCHRQGVYSGRRVDLPNHPKPTGTTGVARRMAKTKK